MNGPAVMYRTKPIIRRDLHVELPNCMYKVNSIHAAKNETVVQQADHVSSSNKNLDISEQKSQNLPEMGTLELRQHQILNQLSQLKKQMLSLKADLKHVSNNTTQIRQPALNKLECPIEINKLPEIVINVSPSHPPYSLKIMQKLWRDCVYMFVRCHTHSSVASLPEGAANLAASLEDFKPETDLPKMNVRLIWKDIGANTELVICSVTITGEVNVLRYLSRISRNLNYEKLEKPYEIDHLLDTCYRLVRTKTKTERSKLLQVFNKSLGKTQWLGGRNKITIADIAATSAIKQVADNELGVNLSKWYERCQAAA